MVPAHPPMHDLLDNKERFYEMKILSRNGFILTDYSLGPSIRLETWILIYPKHNSNIAEVSLSI